MTLRFRVREVGVHTHVRVSAGTDPALALCGHLTMRTPEWRVLETALLTSSVVGARGEIEIVPDDATGTRRTQKMEPFYRWYELPVNLATLWAWLDERGDTPADGPAYFMEKPWKWQPEWEAMLAERRAETPLSEEGPPA